MQGALFSGWFELAGKFPPSVNNFTDPSQLKVFESPACYGAECNTIGYLKTGVIPTAVTEVSRTITIGADTYTWWYNRMWRASSATLIWGPPEYDDFYIPHDVGKLRADANITTFQPFAGNALGVVTATGLNVIRNASDPSGRFQFDHFLQDVYATTAARVLTLENVLFVCNGGGVFSYDGRNVKEWTLPVRGSLTNFSSIDIGANYVAKWIIGTDKFVIDTTTEKIFDYATSGFLFTTRTLQQAPFANPFVVERVAFVYDRTDTENITLSWQTKSNDGDWYTEEDISIPAESGTSCRHEVMIANPITNCQKFAMRITAMSSNVKIKGIETNVLNLALRDLTA